MGDFWESSQENAKTYSKHNYSILKPWDAV